MIGSLPFTSDLAPDTTGDYTADAYSYHSREEAVNWAKSMADSHWAIKDGSHQTQCVEFIWQYYEWFLGRHVSGNGYDYLTDTYGACPYDEGWTRPAVSDIQPGDIVVWDAWTSFREDKTDYCEKDGHIGIVISVSGNSMVTVEANAGENYGDEKGVCGYKYNREVSCVSGLIRPRFNCSSHKWDKGTVTVKAKHTKTELADGEKTYTCTVCGEQKTEVIKAAHTYGPSTIKKATLSANGSITKKCGKCGKTVTTVIARPKTIKLKQSLVAYNGKVQKPGVLVTDAAGRAVPGASYSVSYLNNVKIGKAKAIVTFRGRYSGARTLSFTIGPVGAAISKIAGGINKITVRWTRRSGVDGYQIQYATRTDFRDKKTVTIKGNKLSAKAISGLRGGTTYYARVRTYKTIKKTTYYSPWSKVVSATAVKGTAEDSAGTNMAYVIKYLRSGDVAKVRAYNKKLPATINESCVSSMSGDMKAAYKKEIQAWENRQTDYGNYYFDDYWLTDLDNDGTAEMLLALWPDSAGAQTIAYKYVNGGLKKLGSVGGMASCHAYPKHNGIVVEYGKMGYNQFTLVTYAGGKLKQEKLRLFDFTSGGSYIGLRNNLKSHSSWNGERYVPDYTDLN